MPTPAWRTLALDAGVLREPAPEPDRLVLWLPGPAEAGFRRWERIGNVPGAEVFVEQGVCATAATALPVRQPVRGLLGKLLGRFRKAADAVTWVLPNGGQAEPAGERQTDLLLTWPEDEAALLGEERLRACWPQARRRQRLGPTLFLVGGVEPPAVGAEATGQTALEQAERQLAAARQAGDPLRLAAALTDLGVAALRACAAGRAVALLEEALALV